MPGSNRVAYGNETYDIIIAPTSTPGATPGTLVWSSTTLTGQTAELTATIPGLQLGDFVDIYQNSGALLTGLTIANIRVSAANTLAVTWVAVGGPLTIPTTGWIANVCRPESGYSGLPTNAL